MVGEAVLSAIPVLVVVAVVVQIAVAAARLVAVGASCVGAMGRRINGRYILVAPAASTNWAKAVVAHRAMSPSKR